MVRTYGLTHIALSVRDPERSYRFYEAIFGLVAVYRERDFIQAQTPGSRDVPGSPRLGGAAQLAGLARDIRQREKTVFLFDAGDMFTGMLSNVTRGEAVAGWSFAGVSLGNAGYLLGGEV